MTTGPVLVELVNGEIVTSCAEAWRAECEARSILNLPTLEQRRAWLADLETRRGTAAVDALRATMQRLFDARNAVQGDSIACSDSRPEAVDARQGA